MSKHYYYDDGEAKKGPVTARELQRLLDEGAMTPDTWVRPEDSTTWRRWIDTDFTEEEVKTARSPWAGLWANLSLGQKLGLVLFGLLLLPILAVGLLVYLVFRALKQL